MPSRLSSAGTGAACAIGLAIATFYAGVHFGSTTAGGADSYGYVSQAGLWLNHRLTVQQDIVRQSPWPNAADTWAPLGYRPSPHHSDAIVPLYAPGLPMLMALAQAVGGFCAAFLVVPLGGALTVWLTYALGQRLFDRTWVSIAAALLVATSPIFLYQLMNPMTDVPVTAAWTLSLVLAIAEWPAAAGVAAGVALVIRPNLALVAVALTVWLALTDRKPLRYATAIVPFIVVVGAINASLYESALVSGYGTLNELYSFSYAWTNLRQFVRWTIETQTPVLGLAALFLIVPEWFPCSPVPYPRALLVGFGAAVKLSYLFYQPFDAWWYLRFLLPVWPVAMVLTIGAVEAAASRLWRPLGAGLAIVAVVFGANGVRVASDRFAFDVGRAERRYVDVARFITTHTDDKAVIVSVQHSGTIVLYARRLTLRFDQLDPNWLDRAVAFLDASGRHPYIVVEAGEASLFRNRFAAASAIGRLDWTPFARLASADVTIYDAIDRSRAEPPLAIAAAASRSTGWRCDPPGVWPPPTRIP